MATSKKAPVKKTTAKKPSPAKKSPVKKTKSGTVDKRTKEGKEICARMAKARKAAAKARKLAKKK